MREYEWLAPIYDPLMSPVLTPLRRLLVRALKDHIPLIAPYRSTLRPVDFPAITDLCCGTGDQLGVLFHEGYRNLTGIDLSQPMLKKAREMCLRQQSCSFIKLHLEDAGCTSLDNSSQDIVIITLALHEKTPFTAVSILREAERILKPKGVLFIADYHFVFKPSIRTWLSYLLIRLAERITGGEHYKNFLRYRAIGGLDALLQKAYHIRPLEIYREKAVVSGIMLRTLQFA